MWWTTEWDCCRQGCSTILFFCLSLFTKKWKKVRRTRENHVGSKERREIGEEARLARSELCIIEWSHEVRWETWCKIINTTKKGIELITPTEDSKARSDAKDWFYSSLPPDADSQGEGQQDGVLLTSSPHWRCVWLSYWPGATEGTGTSSL